ncbi:MAG: hypothetical protein PVJ63_05040 [Thioalkalispiraceae bacterium]|jgi:hypothetical protein
MSKPTRQELASALEQAKYLRESDQDNHFIAKALLSCHYQAGYLREVFHAVEHFLNSGMSETEHRKLLKAVEKARQLDEYVSHREHTDLGLS